VVVCGGDSHSSGTTEGRPKIDWKGDVDALDSEVAVEEGSPPTLAHRCPDEVRHAVAVHVGLVQLESDLRRLYWSDGDTLRERGQCCSRSLRFGPCIVYRTATRVRPRSRSSAYEKWHARRTVPFQKATRSRSEAADRVGLGSVHKLQTTRNQRGGRWKCNHASLGEDGSIARILAVK
jgi:hypothetical protein